MNLRIQSIRNIRKNSLFVEMKNISNIMLNMVFN